VHYKGNRESSALVESSQRLSSLVSTTAKEAREAEIIEEDHERQVREGLRIEKGHGSFPREKETAKARFISPGKPGETGRCEEEVEAHLGRFGQKRRGGDSSYVGIADWAKKWSMGGKKDSKPVGLAALGSEHGVLVSGARKRGEKYSTSGVNEQGSREGARHRGV